MSAPTAMPGRGRHNQIRRSMQIQHRVWNPIAAWFAHSHGITVKQLLWHGSSRTYYFPRALWWRALYATGRYSLPSIASITGHDHTTVLGAINSPSVDRYLESSIASAWGDLDLTGRRFGDVTVTARAPDSHGNPAWRTVCDCGRRQTLRQLQLFDRGPNSKIFCFSPKLLRGA